MNQPSARTRKLAAVMFTDMVGYTALMQTDEADARRMRIHQHAVIERMCREFRGTLVQNYGDGNLILFDSSVDAVRCGTAVQKILQREPVVPLRIGIHMGEVVLDDDGVYGDCVNVASRIESLSIAGAILISEKVNGELQNQPHCVTVPVGEYRLKHVTNPVKVFAVKADGLPLPDSTTVHSAKATLLRSIAVLPFANMSSDADAEYFSDGITEEIINALVRIDGLRVTARTSSFAFKGQNVDLRTLGRQLGVNSILEGSVRKSGNRIRITAQLIDTADGFHLFSETWDRDMKDIFPVQDEIARDVAGMLEGDLHAAFAERGPAPEPAVNFSAYQYYLKALRQLHGLTPHSASAALEFCNEALRIQPGFALAYSAMSSALLLLGVSGRLSTRDAYTRARQSARRALAIDPDLGQAYIAIAGARAFQDWNVPAAIRAIRKGLSRSSGEVALHAMHATLLSISQEHELAVEEAQYALRLDPLSPAATLDYATTLFSARRYGDCLDVIASATVSAEVDSSFRAIRGWINLFRGDYESAQSDFEYCRARNGMQRHALAGLGLLHALLGLHSEARDYLAALMRHPSVATEQGMHLERAMVHLGLAEIDEALQQLGHAAEQRSAELLMLENIPLWDGLWGDARYERLINRMGLARHHAHAARLAGTPMPQGIYAGTRP